MKRAVALAACAAAVLSCSPKTLPVSEGDEPPRFAVSAFLLWTSTDGARSVRLHQRCGEQQGVKHVELVGSLSGEPFEISKQCTNPLPIPVELGDADFVLLRASAGVEGCELELRTPIAVAGQVAGERIDVELQPAVRSCDPAP